MSRKQQYYIAVINIFQVTLIVVNNKVINLKRKKET